MTTSFKCSMSLPVSNGPSNYLLCLIDLGYGEFMFNNSQGSWPQNIYYCLHVMFKLPAKAIDKMRMCKKNSCEVITSVQIAKKILQNRMKKGFHVRDKQTLLPLSQATFQSFNVQSNRLVVCRIVKSYSGPYDQIVQLCTE